MSRKMRSNLTATDHTYTFIAILPYNVDHDVEMKRGLEWYAKLSHVALFTVNKYGFNSSVL